MSKLAGASTVPLVQPCDNNLSQPVQQRRPHNPNPNSKVTFAQKVKLLDFMMAHRELVLSKTLNECLELWTQLTHELNTLKGGVKSCEEWRNVWKLWCATYNKRKNDLSITLLDLKLITFLESLTDKEKKVTELKHFANGTTSLLKACDLENMINAVPQLIQNKDLVKMIEILKMVELTEEAYKTKADFNDKTLNDLNLKKKEIEKDIEDATKIFIHNQKNTECSNCEKNELLKKIRNCIKLAFTPTNS